MNVVHILPRLTAEVGGPAYSVPRLAEALAKRGLSVALYSLAPAPSLDSSFRLCTYPEWSIVKKLGISPALRRALSKAAATTQIMHNHGLWMLPNVYPGRAVRGTACRLVTSPRGTLAPWALQRSWWKKQVMWWVGGQRQTVLRSQCLHATSPEEYEQIRAVGLTAPVTVIPNGIDIPPDTPPPQEDRPRRLLFLSRIHPKKGIDLLLHAWRKVQEALPDWELHVVGPDEDSHLGEMQRLAGRLAVERVSFLGPRYGSAKGEAFRDASLFILPSHAENFGMVVAEALAHCVPVITTWPTPWKGLETHGCGWWIELSVESIAACLLSACRLSARQLRERGERGRLWMQSDFSWERVGEMMEATYSWLVAGGACPEFVRLS